MPWSARSGALFGGAAVLTSAALGTWRGIRFDDILTGAVIAVFWLAGVVVRMIRPTSAAAGLLLLSGVTGEWFIVASVITGFAESSWWVLLARILQCLTFTAWLAMMAYYPDDQPDRLARQTVGIVAALSVVLPVWSFLDLSGLGVAIPGIYQVLYACPVLGLALLVRTYRRRGALERRQLRWVLLGMTSAAVFYAFSATPLNAFVPAVLDAALFASVTSFVAISAAIGLARPGVADVDLIIRRVPVFAALWVLITCVYAAATATLSVGAGQHLPVQWAVTLTIVSAMLFQPARRRLERLADRAVFGRRLDGYDVLRDLSASLEASTHLDQVGQVITGAIASSVDASWVRLASSEAAGADGGIAYGVAGVPDGAVVLQVPVVHAATVVGVLECGRRRSGTYTEADRQVVATVGRQAALAVLNVQRAAQVTASRRRLVEAADTERTRIERDLHDGVQQHLVALMAAIETARHSADPVLAEAALDSARDIGRGAIVELRSVIGGILPPVLADGGLVAAVQARAGQLPLPIRVEVMDGAARRFRREIEIAGYFFASETLVNVVKHACSRSACIRLAVASGRLQMVVKDDGRGIPPETGLRGLQGLRDRFAALDGTILIDRPAGGGTLVHGELPL